MLTSTLRRALIAAVLLTPALALLGLAGAQEQRAGAKDPAAKLLKERMEVLTEISQILREMHKAGQTSTVAVLAAEADVLSARLELARGQAERIAVLKQIAENARRLEEVVQRAHELQETGRVEALQALAFRLKVEAELARARAGE